MKCAEDFYANEMKTYLFSFQLFILMHAIGNVQCAHIFCTYKNFNRKIQQQPSIILLTSSQWLPPIKMNNEHVYGI